MHSHHRRVVSRLLSKSIFAVQQHTATVSERRKGRLNAFFDPLNTGPGAEAADAGNKTIVSTLLL
jgi:hypothetical protein